MRMAERRLRHIIRQEILREEAPAPIPGLDSRIEAKKREGYTEIPVLTSNEIPAGKIVVRCFVDHHAEIMKYMKLADGWSAGGPMGVVLYMTDRWDGELVNKQGEPTGTRVRGAFHDVVANLAADPDGASLRVGDELFPVIPHRGAIYKILKKGV